MTDGIIQGAAAPESHAPESHAFEYHGRGSDLVPIILVNLLLTILTLGIYRFWGRTRVRKFVWSHARFMGDSFEYTGTGLELFIGFVIVLFTVFLPMGYLIYEAQTMMLVPEQQLMGAVLLGGFYLLFFFLFGLAVYRRNKYRLSRTQWRGIRGAQHEAGFKYALLSFGLTLLTIVTLGLATPYVSNKLWDYEQNRRDFGNGRFSYDGTPRPLYKRFLVSFGLFALIVGVGGYFMFDAMQAMETSSTIDPETGMPIPDPEVAMRMVWTVFIFYIGIGLASGPIMLWYVIKQVEHFMGNSRFEYADFSFHGTYGGILQVWLLNLLIYIVSFGLAGEIAEMRMIRYFIRNLRLTGELDVEAIAQTSVEAPMLGEGLAEGFDLGGI